MPSSPPRKVHLVSDISTLSTLFGKQYDSTTLWFLLTFPGSNMLQLFELPTSIVFPLSSPCVTVCGASAACDWDPLESDNRRHVGQPPPPSKEIKNAKTHALGRNTLNNIISQHQIVAFPKGRWQIHSFDNSRSSTSRLKNAPYMAESQPCLHD